MKVKGIFTQISGSLGGVVGSHNKGGQYLRARTVPVNPNTADQQRARTDLSDAAAEFGNLTDQQKQSWRDFAEQQAWTNSLGDAIQLSGQQAFVGINAIQLLLGNSVITTPPTPNTRPGAPQITATASAVDSPDFDLSWDNETGNAGDSVLYYAGRKVGPGVNYYRGPYRFLGEVAGDAGPNQNLSYYIGFVQGDRIPIRARSVLASGQYSPFTEEIVEVGA